VLLYGERSIGFVRQSSPEFVPPRLRGDVMSFPRSLMFSVALLIATLAGLCGRAGAGTTGGLSGTVVAADTKAPVAGAKVSLSSPSQIASVTTGPNGHFSFVSLAPDTYTIAVEKEGFEAISLSGISVFADAQQTLSLTLRVALRTIGRVAARSNSDLVKPGQTADVYSVNAAQQDRVSALGGGGGLNSAYSAIASVPGAYVPFNQSGYDQTVHIRGGDAGQVGYEFDGIPVNRAFDNYPSGAASSLGQQELQVYTGASPADSEAQGLAGFVNQVIKTGTYPSYQNVDFSLGSPAFYHSLNVEFGGATQSRTFSYYVGLGGYNQDHRYVDQFDGASLANEFGTILNYCPSSGPLPPSCFTNGKPNVGAQGSPGFILGPLTYGGLAVPTLATRSTVINVHFGLPHKSDGLKDDIQILYDNDEIFTPISSSAYDEGLQNVAASNASSGLPPADYISYTDAWQYNGPIGKFLPSNYASLVTPYLFPASPQNRAFDGPIGLGERDVGYNQQGIVKLQYQKNFSSQAYLRLYGYTYYSDYIQAGPNSSTQPITGYYSGDYELSSHTRGLSATFADQINAQNLLDVQASYTASTALRMYNEQMFGGADAFAVVVNKNAPLSGICYAVGSGSVASPTTCNDGLVLDVNAPPTTASLSGIGCTKYGYANCPQYGATPVNLNGVNCGTGPCAYYVAENGQYGEYNLVKPVFAGYSVTDEFKPSDRFSFNAGLRLDHYTYLGADTAGPARQFWFNAFNQDTCYNPATGQLSDKTTLTTSSGSPLAITAPCANASGGTYQTASLQNVSNQQFSYDVLQPRVGGTYTVDADTVLRASYGKYNEQPSSAYQQYSALQQNLPDLLGPAFYSYGFTTPGHPVRPSISYNSDFSLEHHFKNTGLSLKLTPFYRQTKDQVQDFYLNVKASLVSGLNIGSQTSRGFEFALDDGDFARNGFAGQLSFAYTNSYVNYATLPNGSTIVSPINADIEQYNAYTSYCANHPADSRCGGVNGKGAAKVLPTNGLPAAPCYSPSSSSGGGTPDPTCAPGDVANPYWNAPVQPLLDPTANYLPYTIFPAGIGTGENAFNYPYVATLILNYKKNRFAVTPSLQFVAGNRYGAPESTPGIDPATCGGSLATALHGDPRYPYGAPGGSPFDATLCSELNAIPDPYTGQFDGIGAFREPAQLLGNLRLSYQASKNVELVATFTNVIDRCFGGQATAFTYANSAQICSYSGLSAGFAPVGNGYNPGDNVQTFQRYPYEPSFGSYNDNGDSTLQPFSAFLSLRVKL
jgi:hypothetical protein